MVVVVVVKGRRLPWTFGEAVASAGSRESLEGAEECVLWLPACPRPYYHTTDRSATQLQCYLTLMRKIHRWRTHCQINMLLLVEFWWTLHG